jgi:hypothetical protein
MSEKLDQRQNTNSAFDKTRLIPHDYSCNKTFQAFSHNKYSQLSLQLSTLNKKIALAKPS